MNNNENPSISLDELDQTLEAVLLVSGDGIRTDSLKEALGLQKSEIEASLARLQNKYSGNSGILLIRYNDSVQFSSNPTYGKYVEKILNPIKEKALTGAVLETVAIIAYRQPITKLEIENVRGVNSDYAVGVLLKHNLIEAVGRKDALGKPLLFGTTDEFLKRFRLESLGDLPDYDKLLESIQILKTAEHGSKSLYNEFELPEKEIPEFLSDEKVETI